MERGAAARGQVFQSTTDANDASEEELEAASGARGERGSYPRIHVSTWIRKKKKKNTTTIGILLMKLYFLRVHMLTLRSLFCFRIS